MTNKIRLAAIAAAAGAMVAVPAAAAQAAPAPAAPHAAPADCDFPGCDQQGGGFDPRQGFNHWEWHQHERGGPGWHDQDFGGLSTGSSGGPGGFGIG